MLFYVLFFAAAAVYDAIYLIHCVKTVQKRAAFGAGFAILLAGALLALAVLG